MSQVNVERVIGLLATDEALRREFMTDPRTVLLGLIEGGMELNPCELGSLTRLSPYELARFAQTLDARLQRVDPRRDIR
jgi:hypothetical protein